jgi:hypothetical protein
MVWFKVDDNLAFHPKVLLAGNAAMGLWVRAGSWCSQQLTDGVVPDSILPSLGTVKQAEALVRAGLWTRGAASWSFHEWSGDGRQPTRDAVEAERAATRERVRKHRERQESSRRDTTVTNGVSNADVTPLVTEPRPDPTRPDPLPKGSEGHAASRGTRIPTDFSVDDLMRQYARSKAPAVDVARETEKFTNYWTAVAGAKGVKKDWVATWRNWMLQAQGYAERDGWKPQAESTDVNAENAARDRWLEERGITLADYQQHWDDPGWLDEIEARVKGGARG